MIGSLIYRGNFKAERDRMKFYADGLKPQFMTAIPSYVEDLLVAQNRVREGNIAEAQIDPRQCRREPARFSLLG